MQQNLGRMIILSIDDRMMRTRQVTALDAADPFQARINRLAELLQGKNLGDGNAVQKRATFDGF